MAKLIPLQEALDELDSLYDIDEAAAALFDVLLESLNDDADMLSQLFKPANHFRYKPSFEIKKFVEMWNLGKNIFIIKVRGEDGGLLPYRMLIGYHSQIDTFYVLTVVERETNYDCTHPDLQRAIERYDQLGIPTYKLG